MKQKSLEIFPTLVMEFDLSMAWWKTKIKDYIENFDGIEHGLLQDNAVSDYGYGNILDNPNYGDVRQDLQKCVDIYCNKMNLKICNITNSWINHMTNGGSVKFHRHEGSVVSGAYYPQVDDNSCDLIFNSPLKPYRMNDLFLAENDLNAYTYRVPSKKNTLYLFPSWLEHGTESNKSNNRFVLSFNTDRK